MANAIIEGRQGEAEDVSTSAEETFEAEAEEPMSMEEVVASEESAE
jgi:hypothetical protein